MALALFSASFVFFWDHLSTSKALWQVSLSGTRLGAKHTAEKEASWSSWSSGETSAPRGNDCAGQAVHRGRGPGGRASNLIGESVISKLRDEDEKC